MALFKKNSDEYLSMTLHLTIPHELSILKQPNICIIKATVDEYDYIIIRPVTYSVTEIIGKLGHEHKSKKFVQELTVVKVVDDPDLPLPEEWARRIYTWANHYIKIDASTATLYIDAVIQKDKKY